MRYVAQENLEPLPSSEEAAISHELLPHLFVAYDRAAGVFLPVQQLSYWYPSDRPPPLPPPDAIDAPMADAAAGAAAGAAAEVGAATTAGAVEVAADGDGDSTVEAVAAPPAGATDAASLAVVSHVVDSSRLLLRAHALDASRKGMMLDDALTMLRAARTSKEAVAAERTAVVLLGAHRSPDVMQLTRRAEIALEADDSHAALGAIESALALDDAHADSYARRGAVHAHAGQPLKALADAERALEIEPRHFNAMRLRGAALRSLRRHTQVCASSREGA